MKLPTALVVDDNPANRSFLSRLLHTAQFEVYETDNGTDALIRLDALAELQIALVDMQLPDMSGLQLTKRVRCQFPTACVVVATVYDDRSWMERAFSDGCDVFLVKPHGFMELFQRLTTRSLAQVRAEGPLVIDQYGPRPF